MPDHSQTPLDEVYNQDFDDPNPPHPSDDLAGLPLINMEPLNLDSDPDYQLIETPNNPDLPDLAQSGSDLYSMSLVDQPWNVFGNMLRNNNNGLVPDQSQYYNQTPSGNKRRRITTTSDSGLGTQRSSTLSGFEPQNQRPSHRPPQGQFIPSSATVSSQHEDIDSHYPQERHPRASSFSSHRNPSLSPSRQSPPRSVPKAQRKASNKYFCDQCTPLPNFTGFGTPNDRARHLKAVHGILEPGEKVWICKIHGCISSNKIWPRRDNFQSHLKRIHFHNDDTKARNEVDRFQESYDFETHGAVKNGNARGGSRSKSIQGIPLSSHAHKRASVPNTEVSQHGSMVGMNGQGHDMFNQLPSGMYLATSGTLAPVAFNYDNRATAAMSIAAVSTPFFQPHRMEVMGRNMGRPGYAYTAPPNPDNLLRQRREMEEHDPIVQSFPSNSMEDLNSIGLGTVDPALLSNTRSDGRSTNLNATSDGPRTSLDPEKELEDMLRNLPPEQRTILSKYSLETIARCFNKVGQNESSDQVHDSSKRSASKPSAKKKADSQKILRCPNMVEKKGEKGEQQKTLVQCIKTFSSPSELRKHRKRHEKNFGCTFDECYSKFGTKWEWKRHEQNQHIQNEAWRCKYKEGNTQCQSLFSESKAFEEHLIEHFDKSNRRVGKEEFAKEVEDCHLPKKWLGSYWCGYCPGIIRSMKKYGRDMDDERVEHIGGHIHQGCRSSDWVELAAGGMTKGQMKERKEASNKSETQSSRTQSSRRPSHQETEEEDGNDDEGDDSDESEAVDTDESSPPTEPQQSRPSRPILGVITAQNSPGQSGSQGSRTEPLPTTPKIQVHTPEGVVVTDDRLDAINARPMQPQRAHTDNNPAGYTKHHQAQQQYQHYQRYQAQSQLHSPSQPYQRPHQVHNIAHCCVCQQQQPSGTFQGKCEHQNCQHECGSICTNLACQGNFMPGSFSNDHDTNYGFYAMNLP